jgi:hypothetical protein
VSTDRADLAQVVAHSADTAGLHAPVPTLLLELQTLLGGLAATVAAGSERGRRPFRPGPDWPDRLGQLAYGVYLLADQTGVDLGAAVTATAGTVGAPVQQHGAPAQQWVAFGPDQARP